VTFTSSKKICQHWRGSCYCLSPSASHFTTQAVEFGVEMGKYEGVVRVPRRVFHRLLLPCGPGSIASPTGSCADGQVTEDANLDVRRASPNRRSRPSTVVRCDRPRWQVIRTPDLRAEVFGGYRSSAAYRRRVRRWRRDPNRQPQAALRHVRLLPCTGPAPAQAADGASAAAGFCTKELVTRTPYVTVDHT
jgi:hypothetical protein